MADRFDLQRFIDAQQGVIETALAEIRDGQKRTHWMWFVFPQLAQLGRSEAAKFYGLASLDEARAYLSHDLLGPRLRESVEAILGLPRGRSADQIFGSTDAMKLRSSLTLFDRLEPDGTSAEALLNFFGGQRDELTLALLDGGQ